MGYRSDVRISLSTDGFNELSSYVYDYFRKNNEEIQYNLLEHMDICHKSKKSIYFGWNDIKWYEDEPQISSIMLGLEHLKKDEYSTRYLRIGEDYNDIEEQYTDGKKDGNINIEYPYLIRRFDDDHVFRYMDKNRDLER